MDTTAVADEQVTQVVSALGSLTFERFMMAAIVLMIGLVIIRVLMHALARVVEKLPLARTMTSFMLSVVRIVMIVVLVTIVSGQLGIPTTSLVALLSLFALAVSLSVQDLLSNVVSGVLILTAKPFSAGDYIEADSVAGTVESIDLMYTHLLAPDNKLILVPNKQLSAERITNNSAQSQRRVDVSVRVGYEHTNEAVIAALLRAAARVCAGRESKMPPFANVNQYLDTGIEFVVRVYVPTPDYWDVYHALLGAAREELARDGIALSFGTTRVQVVEQKNA